VSKRVSLRGRKGKGERGKGGLGGSLEGVEEVWRAKGEGGKAKGGIVI
jgi:hypothetical protein